MQTINYEVRTEVFEGPLELLLQLVEKRKLFINDISLAQVADDYIEHIRAVERFPIGDAASFVLVASVLILIKSKSLLPKLDLSEEEEQSMDELENRLREYQKIKDLSVHVAEKFGKSLIFPRTHVSKHMKPIFAPEPAITQDTMLESVLSAIKKVPKPEPIEKRTVRKVVSLEEMIDSLSERMSRSIKMHFSDFSNQGRVERVTVVVSFLAMLELVKQGTIVVQQDTVFSDILMERNSLG